MSYVFEREFFALAAIWLACRLGQLEGKTADERTFHFLGEMDFHAEMFLLIESEKNARLSN